MRALGGVEGVRGPVVPCFALVMLMAALLAALALGALAPPADAVTGKPRVMTRNLYLGADLTPLILAPTKEQFRQRATEVFRQVKRTDFPARAKLLAREIDGRNPHLVGLQEVALWRRTARGETGDDAQLAKRVVFNFLRLLNRALKDRGERYLILEVQREADLQGPTSRAFHVRLTMRDVILVRRGTPMRVVGSRGRNFRQNLVVPTAYGPVTSTRGWTAADVRLGGHPFRFVNTHLEAFSAAIRTAQAEELTRRRGALRTPKRTILVGDLNSDPKGSPENAAAYQVLRRQGFRDAWLKAHPDRAGLTCCFSAEVNDRRRNFSSRIDHVLFRGRIRARGASRVGIDRDNRTASGLWPSDHAGVVSTLRLRGR